MKTLIAFIIVFLFPCFVNAANVTLRWDANTESDLAGYRIHHGLISGVYGVDTWDRTLSQLTDPDNPSIIITGLADGVEHYFVVTAYDNENPSLESGYSNEVMFFKPLSVEGRPPENPSNLAGEVN